MGIDGSLFARLASNAWIGARQANTIDEKGVNMNNKAAKLAARTAQESAVALPAAAEPPLLAGECASHIDGPSVQGPALP